MSKCVRLIVFHENYTFKKFFNNSKLHKKNLKLQKIMFDAVLDILQHIDTDCFNQWFTSDFSDVSTFLSRVITGYCGQKEKTF